MENKYRENGIDMTIVHKPAFVMVGYRRAIKLGDGSIGSFIRELDANGKMQKLSATLSKPQQIWVCLSDCESCGLGCSDFHACCRICIEKTENHVFSSFEANELSAFRLPASEWVLYEAKDRQSVEYLHKVGVYELVKKTGYQWNENIRLHFDNEHECIDNHDAWVPNKTYHFLLPIGPMQNEHPS